MKRNIMIFTKLVILACAVCLLAGCVAKESASTAVPTTTQPQQDVPAVHTLTSKMYCTVVIPEEDRTENQFEAELDVRVVEDPEGNHSFDLNLALSDDLWYDFSNPQNSFTLQHEELGLPYYCAKAYIHQPILDGYGPYDFAVDFEKEYMIFKESSNISTSYVVASSDPDVDPMEIAEHFVAFLRIYDYSAFDKGTITEFYYDLSGTWISEDSEVLEEMNFYITGTLPDEYADGDEVEMKLNFVWPESFGYRNDGYMTYTGSVDIFEKHHGHPNFHGTGTLCDSETNEQITFVYNIFPYDSTVIIYMNGQYLINDPPHDKSQVGSKLNYYKEFIFTTP